ncbi:MAG: phosphomannose isomerase type II C-terminal cupin domain [Cyanobacteria bacterium P01_A01_bin.135]
MTDPIDSPQLDTTPDDASPVEDPQVEAPPAGGEPAPVEEAGQREARPWGSFTVLETGPGYKIKRVEVNPGERLSIQMHYHRSEHWIVVSGTARVMCGESSTLVHANQSTYVPPCTRHRLENPGVIPLVLIEVQNGEYLNEADVKRFDSMDEE